VKDKTDWRKTEEYAFTDYLSNQGWAWEFLRRNPEYKEAWDYYVKIVGDEKNYPLLVQSGKKWKLKELWDPEKDTPPTQWLVTMETPVFTMGANQYRDYLNLSIKDKLGLGFDLSKSIPAQISYAEQILKERYAELLSEGKLDKVKKPGNKPADFPFYLRVLDAWLPEKKMTKAMAYELVIAKDKKSKQQDSYEIVKDARIKAVRYMKKDYIKFLLKPEKT